MRKPTRRDLLIVIGRLQSKIGEARSVNNDRNPNKQAETDGTLQEALDLCILARSSDDPIESNLGPWGVEPPKRKYT